VVLLGVVDACSMPAGWRPLSRVELVQRASDVLFVHVRRTLPDSRRPWIETLYTAEVDVYCILKGQQTPPILNITQVGRSSLYPLRPWRTWYNIRAYHATQFYIRPDASPSICQRVCHTYVYR